MSSVVKVKVQPLPGVESWSYSPQTVPLLNELSHIRLGTALGIGGWKIVVLCATCVALGLNSDFHTEKL
jgi:hypothetical protein